MTWEERARIIEKDTLVDWNEKFYICPLCGEPIYEEDWPENKYFCPVCEDYE